MKITREAFKNIVREVMTEESEYQTFFKKALEKTGKSIPDMSDEEKKAFFNKIDSAWQGKGEKNEELVGNQKKLDVDGDGEIEASDLAALRAGKKVDEAANLKTIAMLFQNKGIRDAVRKDHADKLRKIIEDSGVSTKGVSDSELIKVVKQLTNESVNEATLEKGTKLRYEKNTFVVDYVVDKKYTGRDGFPKYILKVVKSNTKNIKVGSTIEYDDSRLTGLIRNKVMTFVKNESVNEEILKPGTKVKVQHKGKTVSGKIVRYDSKTPGSPFYVVYTGQYDSIEVPAYQVKKESVSESVTEASKPTIKVVTKLKPEQGIQIVVVKTTKGETEYGGFVVRGKLQKVIPVGANKTKEDVKKRALQIWDEFGKQLGESESVNESSSKEKEIYSKIEKLRVLSNAGKITGDEFLDKFIPLWKQLKGMKSESVVKEDVDFRDGKYRFYSKQGVGYLSYNGKVLSHGDFDWEDGSNSYWMSHSSWGGQKAFDSGKDVIAYFKKNKIVKESINEAGGTVRNPKTGKDVKISTALSYGKSHPAYQAAKQASGAAKKPLGPPPGVKAKPPINAKPAMGTKVTSPAPTNAKPAMGTKVTGPPPGVRPKPPVVAPPSAKPAGTPPGVKAKPPVIKPSAAPTGGGKPPLGPPPGVKAKPPVIAPPSAVKKPLGPPPGVKPKGSVPPPPPPPPPPSGKPSVGTPPGVKAKPPVIAPPSAAKAPLGPPPGVRPKGAVPPPPPPPPPSGKPAGTPPGVRPKGAVPPPPPPPPPPPTKSKFEDKESVKEKKKIKK